MPAPSAACRLLHTLAAEAPAQVEILDDANNLESFFEALLALLSGAPGRRKVRVAFYGDSNATMDWAASYLRRVLGRHFGRGGHGFVAAGQSVPWYQHREIRTRSRRGFRAYCVTHPRITRRPYYGHSGHISFGSRVGASVTWRSADSGAPDDEVFSTVELQYLCWPRGGRLDLLVDGKSARVVDTRCPRRSFRRVTLHLPLGRHSVRVRVKTTTVGVFGAVFENSRRGLVIDGLGVGALNVKTMRAIRPDLFQAGLRARSYDLVILHTGTNMWGPGFHPGWARDVIQRIRAALGPRVSILILSPPAFGRWRKGRARGHERMAACAREKRLIAAANGTAFWDYFRSMGGLRSVARWRRSGYIHGDLVHFKPPFHELMMKRLGGAILARFRAFLKRRGLNCPSPLQRSTSP